jgi:hypothetical protein
MVSIEDPTTLTLEELRDVRAKLQHEDDVVSYARRVAQARLDLVHAETQRRESGDRNVDLSSELRVVLSQHLTGGPARPPRPTDDLSDDPLSQELDAICSDHRFSHLEELSDEEVEALAGALSAYEQRVSADRRDRFELLDTFSAELVRRYREGEASVDGLLGEF